MDKKDYHKLLKLIVDLGASLHDASQESRHRYNKVVEFMMTLIL